MASPRTRGWTRGGQFPVVSLRGFPAHAGMDPESTGRTRRRQGLPRARGDGPAHRVSLNRQAAASPRTRGWTPYGSDRSASSFGFPAHAGMDPISGAPSTSHLRLPRARGDGPFGLDVLCTKCLASPRTRGWTRKRSGRRLDLPGFPAHAGMDPTRRIKEAGARGLPRARGDGPQRRE